VPGFDVVLRPAKSVSVLYGVGDPATGRAVLAAHRAGLAEAVSYLDGHLSARHGHGGHKDVSGQGSLAVGFDHRTSREGDPLLHTHLVIANRVKGPDGRWTALDQQAGQAQLHSTHSPIGVTSSAAPPTHRWPRPGRLVRAGRPAPPAAGGGGR
jgi:conjugative relaxase-like TrwC/TraI family protein